MMHAPAQQTSTTAPPVLDVFRARCEARAVLVAEGEMDFLDAVDGLQDAAVAYGLVAEIGQDAVQEVMAAAFAVLWVERVFDIDAVWNFPGWQQATLDYHRDRAGRVLIVEPATERASNTVAQSTPDASAWLFFQLKDRERWEQWLDRHSAEERAGILEYIITEQRRQRQ